MADEDDIAEQIKIADRLLLEAVETCNYGRINLCLQKGADLNARNGAGRTPLMMAVWKDDPSLVKFLLQKRPLLFLKDNEGKNAFDLIASVRDNGRKEEITTIMLSALPDHIRARVVAPKDVAAAAAAAPAGDPPPEDSSIATRDDISLSKPLALAARRKNGGLSL